MFLINDLIQQVDVVAFCYKKSQNRRVFRSDDSTTTRPAQRCFGLLVACENPVPGARVRRDMEAPSSSEHDLLFTKKNKIGGRRVITVTLSPPTVQVLDKATEAVHRPSTGLTTE